MMYWELWDMESGNLIGYTEDPVEAAEYRKLCMEDSSLDMLEYNDDTTEMNWANDGGANG